MSGIVLELQEAMLHDQSNHSKSENVDGVQLVIPVVNVMIKEPKHRLKSHKEVRQQAKKLKANMTVQQMGLLQEISDETYIAVVNSNRPLFHRGFYNNDHNYPECGKRSKLSLNSMEYMLTSDKPAIVISLKNRLKVGIPVCSIGEKYTVVGKVSKPLKNANCTIYEAAEVCVNILAIGEHELLPEFFGQTYQHNQGKTCMWVTGDAMIELMTLMNKLIKWVFDETIIHKVRWVERSSISIMYQETQG